MGRRLFFLLGMVLLIACGPARILGAQEAFPVDAPAPAPASPGTAGLEQFPAEAAPAPTAPAPSTREPLPGMEDAPLAPRAGTGVAPRDEEVEQVQAGGKGPAAAPAPAAAASASGIVPDGGYLAPIERLPLGKHEVLVNVEVQAPAEMNVNKESTVKIIVVNSGSTDALGVCVRDELPQGLKFISSSPPPETDAQGLLTWRLGTLPAGSPKTILLRVVPTSVTHMDHAATVSFQAGSKARTRVLEPKLKVEVVQRPSLSKQLKGKPVEFQISVFNTGDGPVRNIMVLAKLSPGLSYETKDRGGDPSSLEHPIEGLEPGGRIDLPALSVDARQGGRQTCTVKVTSPDVVFNAADAEVERAVDVIEPKLKLQLAAPDKRYTDTVAQYELTIENPGTATAKNVRVSIALPVSGKLISVPSGVDYDRTSKRLIWSVPELPPTDPANAAAKPRVLPFEVRMLDVGFYEVTAEAKADGVAVVRDKQSTDVQGMADLDIYVTEKRRVVDEGNETTFFIRLENRGTKEASNVAVVAEVSKNLQPTETSGGPEGESQRSPDGSQVQFPVIDRIGPGAYVLLGVKVKVKGVADGIGTCTVNVKHDDLGASAVLKGMANVKVAAGRRTADASDPGAR
ncbi:DUF11 domain-containing protein [Paludisphaera rhizosphaerae]|uniref:DUF11 domain-containing protein n=1 Tax=Paludisphaera rhizosphaerae TaxID=2711216 RepID=UPI0013EDAA04|nr:DUF11 domain-containing protein [Paludisphaera rhizosphaerae]